MQWFGVSYYRFILEKSILVPDFDGIDGIDRMKDSMVTPMDCILGCKEIEYEYSLRENIGNGWMHTLEFEGAVKVYMKVRCV